MEDLGIVIASIITVVVSAIGWAVRKILTNEKQIQLMHNEIRERDIRRQEDREIMNEIKADLKEVKLEVVELYKKYVPE
jgi:3-methyladenine DNA glycosylase AlkD